MTGVGEGGTGNARLVRKQTPPTRSPATKVGIARAMATGQ